MHQTKPTIESIGCGVEIFTDARHSFGTDAILLADFAAPKKSDIACDLGTGCGIIPLLWARYRTPEHCFAVELQPQALSLLRQSLAHNCLESAITAVCGDLRQIETLGLPLQSFTLVTMNPPYFAEGSGATSAIPDKALARHDSNCTAEDIMRCADKLLRFGGRLCLCHKPERLADILCAMRRYGIEPKRLRFVAGKKGKAPYLVLLEGRKGSGKQLNVLPELQVQNEDGSWSREMLQIYRDYGDGTKQ